MKQKTSLLIILLSFTSCFFNNYESDFIKSSSSDLLINATVNRTNKNKEDYADVIIHLYNSNNIEIAEFNTKAGDANKWAIGWTKSGDTVILQSSDIGNKSWIIKNNKFTEIKMTKSLNKRAEWLKKNKYD